MRPAITRIGSGAERPAGSRGSEEALWQFEGGAGTLKGGKWVLKAQDSRWQTAIQDRLTCGRVLRASDWPSPAPWFSYSTLGSVPDINSRVVGRICVVSSRFRRLIEGIDRGAAQFMPVRVDGPRRKTLDAEFWAVNWLHQWDCQPDASEAELDPSRVPMDEHVGVVAGKGWWYGGEIVCDGEFRRAVASARVVGVRLTRVPLASGPLGLVPYRDPSVRARVLVERRCIPTDRHFDPVAFLRRFPGTSYVSRTPNSTALGDYVALHTMRGASVRTLRMLLDAGYGPIEPAASDASPVPVIVMPKSVAIMRLLHEHGADWNGPNSIGLTPLMSAALELAAPAVRAIIGFGAAVDARDLAGRSALHHAAGALGEGSSARRDVIRALLDGGADPGLRDREGLSAADILRAAGEMAGEKQAAAIRRCLALLGGP